MGSKTGDIIYNRYWILNNFIGGNRCLILYNIIGDIIYNRWLISCNTEDIIYNRYLILCNSIGDIIYNRGLIIYNTTIDGII